MGRIFGFGGGVALPPFYWTQFMALEPRSPNFLLGSLSKSDFDLLRPGLRVVELSQKEVLVEAGARLPVVYFPHRAIISLIVRLKSGQVVEAAMVGRDGEFGAGPAMDSQVSLVTAIVQTAGAASTIEASQLRRAVAESASLGALIMRHEQVVLAQGLQSAACNSVHAVPARLSRWLLRTRDLTGSDTLSFTQEFLAQMLGRQRNAVTIEAKALQNAGIIKYKRGKIEITDLTELRARSCECYDTVRDFYERWVPKPTI